MQPTTLVEEGERADILDALRGFALLGIFISHMPDYAGTHVSHPVAEFLIRGKFFSLFAFLFGIGFAVQIDSAARRGANFNLALLWQRGWSRMLNALSPAGRMALTTYVSQTLIGSSLFYGIGLGIGDKLSFVEMTLAAVAIFSLQCLASRAWLRSFRFGPLEWLWRRATCGTPVEMLRRSTILRA